MKKLLLILGNGFTIDFIKHIEKEDEIDVRNLFRLGHNVKFPDTGQPGFLSHRHCPSLWLLGARPNKNGSENMSIIEEIITCSNMLFEYLELAKEDKNRLKLIEFDNQSEYIKAYSELIAYLKYLFIEYNQKISDKDIDGFITKSEWGWIPYLKNAYESRAFESISVITYNYDIWLERILNRLGIEYNLCGFEEKKCKVNIVKPHGSISFVPASGKNRLYNINYKIDSAGTDISQMKIEYADLEQYDKSYLVPPAGDSSRRKTDTWAATLRTCALDTIQELGENDEAIICGMSYWHVDRKELDELLINLNQNSNVMLVNPNPPKELNAVLVSLFNKYTVFTSAETLKEVLI